MYCRKLQNGKWTCTADASPDPKTGKRRQVTRRAKTKKEAQQAVRQAVRDIDTEQSHDLTVRDLYNDWMAVYSETVKPSTVGTKKTMMKSFIEAFGSFKIKKITSRDIQNFLLAERDLGLTKRYLNNKKVAYSAMFRHAVEHKYLDENPLDLVVTPREDMKVTKKVRKKKQFLEPEEIQRLIQVAKQDKRTHIYRAIVIIFSTGLRISELLALQWTDIDFDEKLIHVRRTLTLKYKKGAAVYALTTPKTERANRFISFNEQTEAILRRMKIEHNELTLQNLLSLPDPEWNDLVFIDLANKTPYNILVLTKQINRLYKEANIENASGFHILRHTHVTMLVEAGVEIPAIVQRIGHSNSSVTLDVYSHVTNRMKDQVIEKVNHLFENLI